MLCTNNAVNLEEVLFMESTMFNILIGGNSHVMFHNNRANDAWGCSLYMTAG